MSNDQNHLNKSDRPAPEAMTAMAERDAAAKAVRENMARLRAERLAREAAEPQRTATSTTRKKKATSAAAPKAGKKVAEKPPALKDWLASQVSVGRRT